MYGTLCASRIHSENAGCFVQQWRRDTETEPIKDVGADVNVQSECVSQSCPGGLSDDDESERRWKRLTTDIGEKRLTSIPDGVV